MVKGSNWVSASSATMMSPLARAMPRFSAAALPPLASVINCTRGSCAKAAATMALVPSVEPSSMTITSSRACWLASTRRTEASITFASFQAGINTEMSLPSAGKGGGVSGLPRAASQVRLMARARPSAMARVKSAARMRLIQAKVLKMATSTRTATRSAPCTSGITWARVSPASSETGTKR